MRLLLFLLANLWRIYSILLRFYSDIFSPLVPRTSPKYPKTTALKTVVRKFFTSQIPQQSFRTVVLSSLKLR